MTNFKKEKQNNSKENSINEIIERDNTNDNEDNFEIMTQDQIQFQYKQQDDQLEEIYAGAARLNKHAKSINNEVENQNIMLDEIGHNMNEASNDLEKQTVKATMVNSSKKKICIYYVIIIILVITLVVVATIPN